MESILFISFLEGVQSSNYSSWKVSTHIKICSFWVKFHQLPIFQQDSEFLYDDFHLLFHICSKWPRKSYHIGIHKILFGKWRITKNAMFSHISFAVVFPLGVSIWGPPWVSPHSSGNRGSAAESLAAAGPSPGAAAAGPGGAGRGGAAGSGAARPW